MFRVTSFSKKSTTYTSSWIHSQFHEITKQNCGDHPVKPWFHQCLLPEQHRRTTKPPPCSAIKNLLALADIFHAGPSILSQATHNSHRVGQRLPSAQYTTSHSSKCPDKNRIPCDASKNISHSLQQLTAPRSPKFKEHPAVPGNHTPTLQVMPPAFQPPPPSSPCLSSVPSTRCSWSVKPLICWWGAPCAVGETAATCFGLDSPLGRSRCRKAGTLPHCVLAPPVFPRSVPDAFPVTNYSALLHAGGEDMGVLHPGRGCDPQVSNETINTYPDLHPFQLGLSQLPEAARSSSITTYMSRDCTFCVSDA